MKKAIQQTIVSRLREEVRDDRADKTDSIGDNFHTLSGRNLRDRSAKS